MENPQTYFMRIQVLFLEIGNFMRPIVDLSCLIIYNASVSTNYKQIYIPESRNALY